VILDALSRVLGQSLEPQTLTLPGGATVKVDGVADDPPVLVEVFAREGALRDGQRHKVSTDALKLIAIGSMGLPREEGTSELACPRGWPGRMFLCPSPIRRSSATMS